MTTDKQRWRERIRSARDALPARERIEKSRQIGRIVAGRLLLPMEQKLGRPLTVCLYGAFRSEADPAWLADWCWARGHRIAAPRVREDGGGLELRLVASPADWRAGKWGVPEPDPERTRTYGEQDPLDVVLVPGLAFDRQGGRLGYGGGYYDRLFAARQSAGHTSLWIGFAFELQTVEEPLPREPHDLVLDGLATENGLIRFEGREADESGRRSVDSF